MASGSVLIPSASNPNTPLQPSNGHLSPLAQNVVNADDFSSRSDSDISDAKDHGEDASSDEQNQGAEYNGSFVDMETSESSQDEDADGEEDGDYDIESPPAQLNTERSGSYASQDSHKRPKRKASVEDDDYMMQNPELYGLRRSTRSRQTRRIVESSSDNDDTDSDAIRGSTRKRRRVNGASKVASQRPTPTVASTAESDEDSDVYVGSKRNTVSKKQRRRQLQVAAGLAPPSQAEVRFSTRRAAKVSYEEKDDDDFSEDESEMTPNYWAIATEDDTPAIDVVLKHRFKEGIDPTEYPEKQDFEYLIKYQGKAHYHSTWETWSSVSSYRGFRRLENYYRKVVQEELHMKYDSDVPPEEKERWYLEREKEADALVDYQQVERVIGTQIGDDGTEYYVKWKGLSYDCCTWESATVVSELAQSEIDRYLDRSSRLPKSDLKLANVANRGQHKPLKEQPPYVEFGKLREFQLKGVNFLAHNWCKGCNVILADEMGLGKTVQTVSFMSWLRHEQRQEGPFLVVVPLSTLPAWAETFNNWTPDLNYVVYNGNEAARKIIQEYELLVNGNPKQVKFHALLTTYEFILQDSAFLSQIKWQFLAVDEAHRLKNRDSQLYVRLVDFGIPSRLLITGTPMQNTIAELYALMNFLMPGQIDIDEYIDLSAEDASQKLRELTAKVSPYMLRRTKQKVENDLPPKTEKIIRVELSDVQLEIYKNILTRNYAALNHGARGPKQSLLNIMMELKKASNHPFMFPNAEDRILGGNYRREDQLRGLITSSGKMMLLDQLLAKLKKDDHRVLIFSQMVKMLDILGDYLSLRGYSFQRLDGTISSSDRRQAIDHFNAPESSDFCFLLSTRAGGLGINLMTADTVILFDSDWNPQADLQAMARAHRIGQQKPVTIYRLVSKDTVEEEVLERARNKLMLEFITIQRGVTDNDAKDMEKKLAKYTNEPTSSDDIDQILKRRGQRMFEQTGNQKRLEELDIDAVLENAEEHKTEQPTGLTSDGGEEFLKSFEYTDVKIDIEWDDIIPKDELEIIKAAEKDEEEKKMLEALKGADGPRKRKAPNADEREQRAAKKRARQAAAAAAAADASQDESGPEEDPKRPLNEKEIRNLIRAYERYGSFEEREDEIIRDAKLLGREKEILKATLDDILRTSRKMLNDERSRVEAMEKESNKALTKKDKKAILFDYKGVKRLNAETLIERPIEMRMVREIARTEPDWRKFRVVEASKPAQYTCPWGAREDGMLIIGIARHGYGAWVAIREDVELDMGDKFYLEEHRVDKKEERSKGDEKHAKSPGAVHLVRRANYLLSVLKDKTSNGTNIAAKKALENHHRNNKKWSQLNSRRHEKSTSVSASPVPSSMRKQQRESDKGEKIRHRTHGHNEHRQSIDRRLGPSERNGTPELRRKASTDQDERPVKHRKLEERLHPHANQNSLHIRSSESKAGTHSLPSHPLAGFFQPAREELEKIKNCTTRQVKDQNERLKVFKRGILTIGNFIKQRGREGSSVPEDQLWSYVAANFWPKKDTNGGQLKSMYTKLLNSEGSTKQDKGAKTNGNMKGEPAKVQA